MRIKKMYVLFPYLLEQWREIDVHTHTHTQLIVISYNRKNAESDNKYQLCITKHRTIFVSTPNITPLESSMWIGAGMAREFDPLLHY